MSRDGVDSVFACQRVDTHSQRSGAGGKSRRDDYSLAHRGRNAREVAGLFHWVGALARRNDAAVGTTSGESREHNSKAYSAGYSERRAAAGTAAPKAQQVPAAAAEARMH